MQNRYRHLPLVAIVSFWAVGGAAEHARALTFTEFPTPTAGSQPTVITTGPDGALWFVEAGNQINGRRNPASSQYTPGCRSSADWNEFFWLSSKT